MNKFATIVGISAILACMTLTACEKRVDPNSVDVTVEPTNKPNNVLDRTCIGNACMIVDTETKCQYIATGNGGVTPRLTSNGVPMCGDAK